MKRYQCKEGHSFSVNHRRKHNPLWIRFVGNTSLRALALERGLTSGAVAIRIKRELRALPRNEELTRTYSSRWGAVLVVDGVYARVKGWDKVVPFIYGIDYETHDIPIGILDLSESVEAYLRFFSMLREAGYLPSCVVGDDAPALKQALERVFPNASFQLCHVHFLRNIKGILEITKVKRMRVPFFLEVRSLLRTQGEGVRQNIFQTLMKEHERNGLYRFVLLSIRERWEDLYRYEEVRKRGIRCPRTTNLIEAYNNHFKSRVKSIKGFESFSSLERFLNGWLIRRRFTPLQNCGMQFKHLNRHSSFEKSKDPNLPWPLIPGLSPSKIPTRN